MRFVHKYYIEVNKLRFDSILWNVVQFSGVGVETIPEHHSRCPFTHSFIHQPHIENECVNKLTRLYFQLNGQMVFYHFDCQN